MFINAHLPPKANGKPHTNKDYYVQGWNAANAGVAVDDCPYYATSTAEKHWKAGHRSATPKRA
jgi:ribosome modulation factor